MHNTLCKLWTFIHRSTPLVVDYQHSYTQILTNLHTLYTINTPTQKHTHSRLCHYQRTYKHTHTHTHRGTNQSTRCRLSPYDQVFHFINTFSPQCPKQRKGSCCKKSTPLKTRHSSLSFFPKTPPSPFTTPSFFHFFLSKGAVSSKSNNSVA